LGASTKTTCINFNITLSFGLPKKRGYLRLLHHTGKKNSDADRTPIERIMGSQGIAGTAETIRVLE
tara:strand:- start:900 stop:1097 length:198 start_codon:yes stop_codon:yes gene_type:complete